MNTDLNARTIIDVPTFSAMVARAITFAFPNKNWWIDSKQYCVGPRDLADPYSLLPVLAYMAEETWRVLDSVLDSGIECHFYEDDRMQYGYGLSVLYASSEEVAATAVLATLCLNDLPAGNLDPPIESFKRKMVLSGVM